jgi:succinoglycan biosynthesis transport protein ExoP
MKGLREQRTLPDPAELSAEQPVETHLWEYVHVVLRRRNLVLVAFLAIVALTTVKTLLTQPVYEGVTSVLIERADPNVLSFKEVQQAEAGRDDYYQTQYKLLQSRSLARRTIETMNLLNDPEFGGPLSQQELAAAKAAAPGASPIMEKAVDRFLKKLQVRPVRNSRMVNVAFQSYRPDLAAAASNRVSTLYIQQALDFRFQTSSEAGHWLGGQVDDSRKKVEELDRQLRDLKQREGLVNIEERRTLLEQRLKELGTALNERKTERLQKEALWRQMSGARNAEELPEVMRSPLVQNLRVELANLERQQAQLLERYMEQHPEVVRVRKQITETRSKIRSEARAVIAAAENDYRAAAGQEASISSALEAAKAEVLDLSRRTVSYDTQKRELDAANQVLNSLLSRSKETDVASELKASNIRVVDPASVPDEPVKPRKARDISLGALIGFVLSIGLAFFLEYLDNTLKTPDDVRTHLGAPLLGVIPEVADEPQTIAGRAPDDDSPFLEGYRGVRTSLNYSWPEQASRVIVVTSTSPGEGKTITSVNLACILAATEGSVLLIDGDLRKPRTHTYFKARRSPGLSDILVGKAKPSEAIQKLANGLDFLASGTTAPSPADLLTNRSLRAFVDGLRQHYEWVVIDTPPVGAVAEPLILAPLGDGVVVVAGAEMVPRRAVKHTLERIADTGARILGVVLNRAQIEKHAYYYGHYYGHYYGRYGKQQDGGRAAALQGVRDKVAPFTGRRRG